MRAVAGLAGGDGNGTRFEDMNLSAIGCGICYFRMVYRVGDGSTRVIGSSPDESKIWGPVSFIF